uniref:Uncharacterized protein n=1 Tax=Glossina brevipalpis TaxID=37001 RepID=A0A1A9WTH2_9MUSC
MPTVGILVLLLDDDAVLLELYKTTSALSISLLVGSSLLRYTKSSIISFRQNSLMRLEAMLNSLISYRRHHLSSAPVPLRHLIAVPGHLIRFHLHESLKNALETKRWMKELLNIFIEKHDYGVNGYLLDCFGVTAFLLYVPLLIILTSKSRKRGGLGGGRVSRSGLDDFSLLPSKFDVTSLPIEFVPMKLLPEMCDHHNRSLKRIYVLLKRNRSTFLALQAEYGGTRVQCDKRLPKIKK